MFLSVLMRWENIFWTHGIIIRTYQNIGEITLNMGYLGNKWGMICPSLSLIGNCGNQWLLSINGDFSGLNIIGGFHNSVRNGYLLVLMVKVLAKIPQNSGSGLYSDRMLSTNRGFGCENRGAPMVFLQQVCLLFRWEDKQTLWRPCYHLFRVTR